MCEPIKSCTKADTTTYIQLLIVQKLIRLQLDIVHVIVCEPML